MFPPEILGVFPNVSRNSVPKRRFHAISNVRELQVWTIVKIKLSSAWMQDREIIFLLHFLSVIRSLVVVLAVLVSGLVEPASAAERVTLQLKWKHQFQFAGYYMAKAKGFYQDVGLEVEILEADPLREPVQAVLSGEADFGVGTSELMLHHAKGEPVVVLGVIFQHSPQALVVRQAPLIRHPEDLAGKRVMLEPHAADLHAFFLRHGVSLSQLTLVPHTYDVQALLRGEVDAMSIYLTDEPFIFNQQSMGLAYLEPRTAGVDFYGDNLFTSKAQIRQYPERVRRFREASFKGWQYAMEHPQEAIALILEQYSTRHSKAHLQFEADRMIELLHADLIEIGYMQAGRWEHIQRVYHELDMLPAQYQMNGFLYEEPVMGISASAKRWLLIWGGITAAAVMVLIYVVTLNRRLIQSEAEIQTIMANSPLALVVIDRVGTVLNWNKQAEEMFGWSKEEVLLRNAYEFLIPVTEQKHVQTLIHQSAVGTSTGSENWNMRADGSMILCEWRNTAVRNVNGAANLICMAKDITKRKAMEEELIRLAHFDQLTGLPNRTLFYDRFQQVLKSAQRQQRGFALLFLDLNGFKLINDTYGHEIGDKTLQIVAQRLSACLRDEDTVARVGGDEFTVLLPQVVKAEDAQPVILKLQKAVARPILVNDLELWMHVSIGISLYPEDGVTMDALMRVADGAMYTHKYRAHGRQGKS